MIYKSDTQTGYLVDQVDLEKNRVIYDTDFVSNLKNDSSICKASFLIQIFSMAF